MRTPQTARIYRSVFTLIGWSAMLILWTTSILNRPAGSSALVAFVRSFRYFTVQSNLFVLIWLSVALLYWNRGRKHLILKPAIKGAFTVYISVTFLIFVTVLQHLIHPQGLDFYVNAATHYIIPIAFIIDWILYEQKHTYKWRYLIFWLAYPLAYLIITQIHGNLTGDYLYPFLDLQTLGISGLATWVAILLAVFVTLGGIYTGVNQVWGIEKEL